MNSWYRGRNVNLSQFFNEYCKFRIRLFNLFGKILQITIFILLKRSINFLYFIGLFVICDHFAISSNGKEILNFIISVIFNCCAFFRILIEFTLISFVFCNIINRKLFLKVRQPTGFPVHENVWLEVFHIDGARTFMLRESQFKIYNTLSKLCIFYPR